MFIPRPEELLRSLFGIESEDYNRGYEDGYKVAQKEMLEFIRRMKVFYETSTTTVSMCNCGGVVQNVLVGDEVVGKCECGRVVG